MCPVMKTHNNPNLVALDRRGPTWPPSQHDAQLWTPPKARCGRGPANHPRPHGAGNKPEDRQPHSAIITPVGGMYCLAQPAIAVGWTGQNPAVRFLCLDGAMEVAEVDLGGESHGYLTF